jgi:hypothetical protein
MKGVHHKIECCIIREYNTYTADKYKIILKLYFVASCRPSNKFSTRLLVFTVIKGLSFHIP